MKTNATGQMTEAQTEDSKTGKDLHHLHNASNRIAGAVLGVQLVLLIWLGLEQGTLLMGIGGATVLLLPYLAGRFFFRKDIYTAVAALLGIAGLSCLVHYSSGGQANFLLLFFLTVSVSVFYRNSLLVAGTVALQLLYLLGTFVLQQDLPVFQSFSDAVFFSFFLLAFGAICAYLTFVMNKWRSQADRFSDKIQSIEKRNQSSMSYARQIAEGNLQAHFEPVEGDKLGESLLEMSNSLKAAADLERQRSWQIEGIAHVHEILRLNNLKFEGLCNQMLSFLIKYMDANQGGMFIIDDSDADNPMLELKACYAYSRQKHLQKQVLVGEGLLGQAYLEQDVVYLTDVPQKYFDIGSGLGDATPKALIIVPLKTQDQLVGVLEIASFKEIPRYQHDFLTKASESIASAVISLKVKEQTDKLLQASQEMAEELRAQEEEMRQNMEELSATQEDLHRKNQEQQQTEEKLKQSQQFIHEVLNAIPSPIFVKNRAHEIILANMAYQQRIKGAKSGLEVHAKAGAGNNRNDQFREEDEQAFTSRVLTSSEIVLNDPKGAQKHYLDSKAVFSNEAGDDFLINVLTDISERKKVEEDFALERLMFQSLMDNYQDRITFKDKKGVYLRVNKAKAARHSFNDHRDMIGKSDFDYFKAEHVQLALDEENSIMETGEGLLNMEQKVPYANGTFTWASTTKLPLKDEQGKIIGTFCITRDISAQKQIEFTIANFREITAKIAEKAPMVLYHIGRDKNFSMFQGSGTSLMGVAPEAVVGKAATALLPFEKCIDPSGKKEMRFQQKGKYQGQVYTFEHQLIPDLNIDGAYWGFGISCD